MGDPLFHRELFMIACLSNMEELLKSPDRIAYMHQFDKLVLDSPKSIIRDNKFLLTLEEFKVFVSKCINLDCVDESKNQLIHYACFANGDLDIVKCLIASGVDINCANNYNIYPIHYACINGDESLKIVECLVASGADINVVGVDGETPLMIACDSGKNSLNLVEYLLENGADVNAFHKSGTPLTNACMHENSSQLIKCLVDHGAYVNLTSSDCYSPLILACQFGTLESIKILVENGANVNQYDEYILKWPIHYVCDRGDDALEMVEYLLKNGADVNTLDNNGNTLLSRALQKYPSPIRLINFLKDMI